MRSLLVLITCMLVLSFFGSMTSRGEPSSGGVSSSPVVCKQDRASMAWCFTNARRKTSNSEKKSSMHQRAIFLVLPVKFRIHFKDSWFVRMVDRVLSIYGRSRNSFQTIARHSRCVVSFPLLASVRVQKQYPIVFVVSSGCCNNAQFIWKSKSFARLSCAQKLKKAKGPVVTIKYSFVNSRTSTSFRWEVQIMLDGIFAAWRSVAQQSE